ncbi:MAG: hypothetical protein LUF30_04660 [Lachnospiraceae bacterium]|nr:hypothetical protein [Lachnospiraceae bacterium]
MKKTKKLCFFRAAFALLLALMVLGGTAREACADADSSSLDLNARGSIEINLNSDDLETLVVDGTLALYKVANLGRNEDGDMVYTYTEDFVGCPWLLDDVGKAQLATEIFEWLGERDANEENGEESEPLAVQKIVDGTAVFTDLETGLYLVIQTEGSAGYYTIKPFLVSIPFAQTDESGNCEWKYDVETRPKMEFEEPQTESESEAETESETEPESEAESETEPETESETARQTESEETEPESIPQTESETTETTLPQTGQLYWPIPILAVGGIVLAVIGWGMAWFGRKKKHHDA